MLDGPVARLHRVAGCRAVVRLIAYSTVSPQRLQRRRVLPGLRKAPSNNTGFLTPAPHRYCHHWNTPDIRPVSPAAPLEPRCHIGWRAACVTTRVP